MQVRRLEHITRYSYQLAGQRPRVSKHAAWDLCAGVHGRGILSAPPSLCRARKVAAAYSAECLPLHDTLASLLPATHNPPPCRGRFGPMIRSSLSRNIPHRSWDRISAHDAR